MAQHLNCILRPAEQKLLLFKNNQNGIYEYNMFNKERYKSPSTIGHITRKKKSRGPKTCNSMDSQSTAMREKIQFRKISKPFNSNALDYLEQELLNRDPKQLKILTTYSYDFGGRLRQSTSNQRQNILSYELNKTCDEISNTHINDKNDILEQHCMNQSMNYETYKRKLNTQQDIHLLQKYQKQNYMQQMSPQSIVPQDLKDDQIKFDLANQNRTKSVYNLDKNKKGTTEKEIQGSNSKQKDENKNKKNIHLQTVDNVCEQSDKKSDLDSSASIVNLTQNQVTQLPIINKELQYTKGQMQQDTLQYQTKDIDKTISKDKDSQSNCFSVDYSFLDNISISDPRLQKLLNDDLINSKNIDLDYILEQNADYFHHLFNNCACAKCTCGRCRCNFSSLKLNLKNNYQSIYKKEYSVKSENQSQMQTPLLNEKTYENLVDTQKKEVNFEPQTFTSVQKRDYIQHELPLRQIKPQQQLINLPISSLTTYNSQFVNWKEYDPTYVFKRPQFSNILNYKNKQDFQTIYNKTYEKDIQENKRISNANVSDVKKIQQNNPLPELYKDRQARSSYKDNYRNFSINDINLSPLQKNLFEQSRQLTPVWKGQFKSTNHVDFSGAKESGCPAQKNLLNKPWKAKLLNKMKQLRDQNQDSLKLSKEQIQSNEDQRNQASPQRKPQQKLKIISIQTSQPQPQIPQL